jgi:hypothetical protein
MSVTKQLVETRASEIKLLPNFAKGNLTQVKVISVSFTVSVNRILESPVCL